MKIKYITILKIIFIIFTCLSLWTEPMGVLPYKWFTEYLLGIVFILFGWMYLKNLKIEKAEKNILLMLIIPNFIICIYSLFLFIFNEPVIIYSGSYTRAIGLFIYSTIAVGVSFTAFKLFKEKTVDTIFYGFCINYLFCVIIQLSRGASTVINYIFKDSELIVGNLLEAHEISLTIPLFLLYYLISRKKENIKEIIICLTIILIGKKRIVLACTIVAFIYYICIKKISKKKYFLELTALGLVTISLGYVYIIRSGILWEFLNKHWINLMGRDYMWKGIESTYTFSLFFKGNGSGFTTKWLADNSYRLGFPVIMGGLHNDVLRAYIEYGCIAFILYIYNLIVSNTKRIRKWCNESSSMLYLIIILIEIILWLTDNVANYYNYRVVFNSIIFMTIFIKNNENFEIKKKGENKNEDSNSYGL